MKNGLTLGIAGLVLALGFGVATAHVELTTSLVGPSTVPVAVEESWDIIIEISATEDVTDVVVKDGIGADLDEIVATPSKGLASIAKMGKGKMGATMVMWEVGDLGAGETATVVVRVTTGQNAAGKQEFTSPEIGHELDGGASATYQYDGIEYETPKTLPLTVDVVE